jgi:hypothetical protein
LLVGDQISSIQHFAEYLLYDLLVNKGNELEYPQLFVLSPENDPFTLGSTGKGLQNLKDFQSDDVFIDMRDKVPIQKKLDR